MSTDAMYIACNDFTVQSYSATGAQVYMYTFEYRGENSMVELRHGTPVSYFDPGELLSISCLVFLTARIHCSRWIDEMGNRNQKEKIDLCVRKKNL